MKKTFLLTLLVSVAAFAAEQHGAGGHEEAIEIPWEQIGWQAANLGILLVALFFFLKQSVIETFQKRRSDFLSQAEKTKSALVAAELALASVKSKLSTLESGEGKSLQSAKTEADIVKAHMISDAEAQAAKMKSDLQLTLQNELQKAKTEINDLILTQAIGSATKKITNQGGAANKTSEASFLQQLSQVKS